jgi:hypothetical protein
MEPLYEFFTPRKEAIMVFCIRLAVTAKRLSPQWNRLLPGIIADEYRLFSWVWSEKEITYCFVSSVNKNTRTSCVGGHNYF